MFTLTIVQNGKRIRTETRNAGAAHMSAWKTYRDCGWQVTVHNFYEATAHRVV